MIDLNRYKDIIGESNIGKVHRKNSAFGIEQTWERDKQARHCFIYDYYHDSEPYLLYGLHSNLDSLKTPIDVKYVVTAYGSLTKDQIEYHIQFKPSQKCVLDYYNDLYKDTYRAEYPIGLFIDIPEDKDGELLSVYRRWLICSRDYDEQFISYSILPCNECFHWIENNGKEAILRDMCGISRLQNSYNSGEWTNYYITSVENQDKIWLPQNKITDKLFYNQRLILSSYDETTTFEEDNVQPIAWHISKVENTRPRGIGKFTIAQDKFNKDIDKKILNKTTNKYWWYAKYENAYFQDDTEDISNNHCNLECLSSNNQLLIGGSSYKELSCSCYNNNKENITNEYNFDESVWSFTVNESNVKNDFSIIYTDNGIKFRLNKNCGDDYLGEDLVVTVNLSDCTDSYRFDFIC